MKSENSSEFESILVDIRAQLASLTQRIARIEEGSKAPAVAQAAGAAPAPPVAPKAAAPPAPVVEDIAEEDLLAISAALAAYFGVRMHIRQIRLISTSAWAQQGRVSVQASHRLHL